MSSIRTADLPGVSSASIRPSGAARAAARSASLSAAHTHSTSAWSPTDERPETRPPAPRRATSEPSSPTAKETGPRLEAMSTRPPFWSMHARLAGSGGEHRQGIG